VRLLRTGDYCDLHDVLETRWRKLCGLPVLECQSEWFWQALQLLPMASQMVQKHALKIEAVEISSRFVC
jgi:hypothetical protein